MGNINGQQEILSNGRIIESYVQMSENISMEISNGKKFLFFYIGNILQPQIIIILECERCY